MTDHHHTTYRAEIIFRSSVNDHEAVYKSSYEEADRYATRYVNRNGWRGALGYTISHNGRVITTMDPRVVA